MNLFPLEARVKVAGGKLGETKHHRIGGNVSAIRRGDIIGRIGRS